GVRARAPPGRARGPGGDDRLRGLDRPFDRPAPALRVPGERPAREPAAQGHGLGHAGAATARGRLRRGARRAARPARAEGARRSRRDRRRARLGSFSFLSAVELYPAVDVQGGRVVRLRQGDAHRSTAYAGDPIAVARRFAQDGARWVHFVDLDRAFGRGDNRELARRFLAEAGLPVQVGGGLRTEAAVEEMLEWGAARVVIGTKAATDPAIVERLLARHGSERVVVGIDAQDGH